MIPGWLKHFLEALIVKKLGVCEGCCVVSNGRTGSSLTQKTSPLDRFTLQVPYASEMIEWELMFNHNEPDFPPDFIFDHHNFDPDVDNLEHLINWDARDRSALADVVEELYAEYKRFQVSLLARYPKLQTIYDNILQVIDDKLVEVYLPAYDKKTQQQSVMLIIKIEGPFDKIPAQLFNGTEGSGLVLLKLIYHSPEISTKATDSVCLSPRLDQAFGDSIQFPALYSGSNVARYITELKDFLVERIEMLDNGMSKRKGYIEALTEAFTGGVIEVDVAEYHTASVLINYLDFHFILQVSMPTYFPKEQPKLTFRSVYHTDDIDKPFSKSVRLYPWSPRWSAEEMIKRLQLFVVEIIPNFQKASVLQGTALKTSYNQPSEYDDTYN